jgi:ketosteroid isomerase-like protein
LSDVTASGGVETVRRFFVEMWGEGRLEIADELFAVDCVTNQRVAGVWRRSPRDPGAIAAHVGEWRRALADLHVEIEELFSDGGDRVFARAEIRGRFLGPYPVGTLAPTGREARAQFWVVYRLRDSKIAEDWVLVDWLGHFRSLGTLPEDDVQLFELLGVRRPL